MTHLNVELVGIPYRWHHTNGSAEWAHLHDNAGTSSNLSKKCGHSPSSSSLQCLICARLLSQRCSATLKHRFAPQNPKLPAIVASSLLSMTLIALVSFTSSTTARSCLDRPLSSSSTSPPRNTRCAPFQPSVATHLTHVRMHTGCEGAPAAICHL